MKRSEMIEKLLEPLGIEGLDLHLFRIEAEAILTRVEELGMLPPFSSKAASKSNEMDAPGNEWDPE